MNLEQERVALMRGNHPLYAYIAALVRAEAFDEAGDSASGMVSGEDAANRLWTSSRRWATEAGNLLERAADEA